ncbi:MAG: SIS domain-containing protein [bacterium]|nr:SIS domain-containing protein [bacterium]
MEEAIKNFATQFSFRPEIQNAATFRKPARLVVAGMGGSHLAADLLSAYDPNIAVHVHRDYGLPAIGGDLTDVLFVASSYSGNTEETLDFAREAYARKLNLAVVAVGGKLIEFARKNKLPHIVLPDTCIEPRSALGFSITALATFSGNKKMLRELSMLETKLKPAALRAAGKTLAKTLQGSVPVIYSSARNQGIAYNWKIKFNETGKVPAFYNVFPELNHNEMTGFDIIPTTSALSEKFHFIFLTDIADHSQIKKRMAVCKKLYENRGLTVTTIPLSGTAVLEKIFNSLLLADWAALYTAKFYGASPDGVPMVEEFKRLIA